MKMGRKPQAKREVPLKAGNSNDSENTINKENID